MMKSYERCVSMNAAPKWQASDAVLQQHKIRLAANASFCIMVLANKVLFISRQGSTPKHAIYTFIIYSQICAIFVCAMWEKNENKQKEAEFGLY